MVNELVLGRIFIKKPKRRIAGQDLPTILNMVTPIEIKKSRMNFLNEAIFPKNKKMSNQNLTHVS